MTAAALAFALAVLSQLLLGVALLPAGLRTGPPTASTPAGCGRFPASACGSRPVSVVGALVGCSIAAIGRNTAAALGIAFGYFAIVKNAIRGLRPRWTPWLRGDNLAAVVTNQPQSSPVAGHSTLGAATLVACYGLAVVTLAVAIFRRRDIA